MQPSTTQPSSTGDSDASPTCSNEYRGGPLLPRQGHVYRSLERVIDFDAEIAGRAITRDRQTRSDARRSATRNQPRPRPRRIREIALDVLQRYRDMSPNLRSGIA